jgi:hypothetical protein
MARAGRPERPIDPTGGPLPRLAGELRRLRGTRTYRELAAETGLSVAALRAAAAGEQLPTWRVTRAFAVGCGAEEGAVRELWEQACAAAGRPISSEPRPAELVPIPNPEAVSDAEQFVEELQRLRVQAGNPPLTELNRRSGGYNLPPSTVSEMLRKRKLPRLDLCLAYVRACGEDDERVALWERAWTGLKAHEMHEQLSEAGEPGEASKAVLDQHRQSTAWTGWHSFLVWMSGARPAIFAQTPADRAAYTALGGTVLLISAVGALSAAFALHVALVLGPPAAVTAGLVWGVVLASLDRMIVASVHRGQGWKNVLAIVPRVLIAALLGVVVATSMTLRIFAPEINAQIVTTRAATLQVASRGAAAPYNAEITDYQEQVYNLQSLIGVSQKNLQCQLYGGSGCPKGTVIGDGPLAKNTENTLHDQEAQLATLQNQINLLNSQEMAAEQHAESAVNASNQQGLLSRLDALELLAGINSFVAATQWLLLILFTLIGCVPVIARTLKVYGTHDGDEQFLRMQELDRLKKAAEHQLAQDILVAKARVERARVLRWEDEQLQSIAREQSPDLIEGSYDFQDVDRLLTVLRNAGENEAVSTLAARAARSAPIDDPKNVDRLLAVLRNAGQNEAVSILAARAAQNTPSR